MSAGARHIYKVTIDFCLMSDGQTKGGYVLAAARICIGWLFLWPFFDKMFGLGFSTPSGCGIVDGVSPSSFVIYVTDGVFKDFYCSLAGNVFIDILMMSALLLVGISLILGVASKLGTVGGVLFFMVMYALKIPPTDNPIIDHRVICILSLIAIYYLGGFERLSFYRRWKDLDIVKRLSILE